MKKSTMKLMAEVIPNFCWQTAEEIFLMVEQEDWDVNHNHICVVLPKLIELGIIEKKLYDRTYQARDKRGMPTKWLYKKVDFPTALSDGWSVLPKDAHQVSSQ